MTRDQVSAALPHSLEAEEAVLGAALLNPDDALAELAFLQPADFYTTHNGWIFEAMRALYDGGQRVDYFVVIQELERAGRLGEVGGAAYILGLLAKTPSALNAAGYGRIVQRLAVRRRLIDAAGTMARLAHSEDREVDDVLDEAARLIDRVTDSQVAATNGATPTREVAADLLLDATVRQADPQDVTGIPCGLSPLDRALGGFEASLLYLIAGRTGMGKSALLATLAHGFAQAGHPVLVFSLEMTARAMLHRIVSRAAQVDNTSVRRGRISDAELKRYRDAALAVGGLPLHIEALSGVGVRTMRGIARRYVREHGVEVVMVDTLNRVRAEGTKQYERLTTISHEMADWAHGASYAVVAAAQLNRAPTQLRDKRPTLDTLRDSGAQEEDADVVLGLHREGYYDRDTNDPHLAELWALKVREGMGDMRIDLYWEPSWPGFAELARAIEDPPDIARAKQRPGEDRRVYRGDR